MKGDGPRPRSKIFPSNFLGFRRTKEKSPRPASAPKPKNAAPDQEQLFEAVQLKLGRIIVENSDLVLENQALKERIKNTEGKREQTTSPERIEELQRQVEELSKSLKASINRSSDLQSLLDSAEHRAQNTLTSATLEGSSVLSELQNLEAKHEHLTIENALLHQKQTDLEKVNIDLRQKVEYLQPFAALQETVKLLTADNDSLKLVLEETESSLRSCQHELDSKSHSLEESLHRLKETATELQTRVAQEDQQRKEREGLLRDLQQFQENAMSARSESQRLRVNLVDAQKQTTVTFADLENCKTQLDQVMRDRDQLIEAINKSKAKFNEYEDDLKALQALNSSLKLQLDVLQREKRQDHTKMAGDYERRIEQFTSVMENETDRKIRALEASHKQNIEQLKAERDKLQETYDTHRAVMETRLQEHRALLLEQHSSETEQLKVEIQNLTTLTNDQKKELNKLKQVKQSRESELRKKSEDIFQISKKVTELESQLNEANTHCSFLNDELKRLSQLKDPETIVQAKLSIERVSLKRSLEAEYTKSLQETETRLREEMKQQLDEQRKLHDRDLTTLRELNDDQRKQLSQNAADWQKRRAELIETKRSLEAEIDTLKETLKKIQNESAKTLASELKTQAESKDRLIRKLKQEKTEALQAAGQTHQRALEALEDKLKNEKALLQRQHREEQRELIEKLRSCSQKPDQRDQLEELQRRNSQLLDERQRILSEMEISYQKIIEKLTKDHENSKLEYEHKIHELIVQSADLNKKLTNAHLQIAELWVRLEKTRETCDEEIRNLKTAAEKEQREGEEQLRAEHKQILQELHSAHNEQLDRFQTQLKQLFDEVKRRGETETSLKCELEFVKARNQELETSQNFVQRKLLADAAPFLKTVPNSTNSRGMRIWSSFGQHQSPFAEPFA